MTYTDDQEYSVNIGIIVDTSEDEILEPFRFALIGNYPNPFNSSTVIRFRLGDPAPVQLDIFNLLGQKIETLINSGMGSGEHEVAWNAGKVPSGVYFYKLSVGNKTSVKKMTILK